MSEKLVWTGVRRGFACKCPACGKGRVFGGFLKVRSSCEGCGADNRIYPSDDFPPYLTIIITAHVLIPLFMWVDHAYEPAMWLEAAIWLPLTALMCLALLPSMKGVTIGICWARDLIRQDLVPQEAPR